MRPLLYAVAATVLLATACGSSLDDAATTTMPGDPTTSIATAGETDATGPGPTTTIGPPDTDHLAIGVDGNQIVDAGGAPIRLHGVNISGTEYACSQGWGFFEAPATQETIDAMKTWNVNVVRLQLNEHCWLGVNGVDPALSGANYHRAITEWIDLLGRNDIRVIVGLSWSGPGDTLATHTVQMANRDHSLEFWRSAVEILGNRPHVIFGLYSEPHEIDWACWYQGCTFEGWETVGIQELIDTVRDAGATQPLLIPGIDYANDATGFLDYELVDPLSALIVDGHIYSFSVCFDTECLDTTFGAVAETMPVLLGEIGENDCSGDYTMQLLDWADERNLSYLAWTWNVWDICPAEPGVTVDNLYVGPDLLLDYDGTPHAYGDRVRDRLHEASRP